MTTWISRVTAWLERHPYLLFVLLYAAIALLVVVARAVMPASLAGAAHELTGGRGLSAAAGARFGLENPLGPPPEAPMWAIATVAMASAAALGLPVAWLYTITRAKRGYRQSVVHSLLLLPLVVAGVVVLVKFSLALAFSLAGIVAAVRFRTTIEDSKDAVYFFVVTGIGLASGVELSAAATLSLVFNFVTLALFTSDFGRTPGRLEGERAEERMRRALAIANRTSQFVARLDREVLEEMAPEQLEALADRAWQRRKEATGGGPAAAEEGEDQRFDTVLVVHTDGASRSRESVEAIIARLAKRWRFMQGAPGAGEGRLDLTYELKLKKSVRATELLDAIRADAASGVLDAELR